MDKCEIYHLAQILCSQIFFHYDMRKYLIDYYLRGIFAFSAFSLEQEQIDEVVIEYLTSLIIEDLREFNQENIIKLLKSKLSEKKLIKPIYLS